LRRDIAPREPTARGEDGAISSEIRAAGARFGGWFEGCLQDGRRLDALRYVLTILGILLIVGTLAAIKGLQINSLMAHGEKAAAAGPPPETVGSAPAEEQRWTSSIDAVGSVSSAQGLSVSSEAAGRVARVHFDSGDTVRRGEVLVELDASVEQAQLASVLAQKQLAETELARTRALLAAGAVPEAEADADRASAKGLAADAAALRAQIAQKTIRAPFAGRLGIRQVNVGEYLSAGTPVAVLETTDETFVDFTIPQNLLSKVSVGMPVKITWGVDPERHLTGKVQAVSPALDATTRSVQVRAGFPDQDELSPGMFVEVAVVLPAKSKTVVVPATAVVHASYGDSVFVVEDKKPDDPGMRETPDGKPVRVARQRFVRTGRARGDFVEILEGIGPQAEVVTAGAFKLRNGAPIVIGDRVEAEAKLEPKPENR
jgi:membrane fusion protein, multidrug efflux system